MEKEIFDKQTEKNTSEEELKYQVDLLTASQNRLKESEQLYQRISEYARDGYYYANIVRHVCFASAGWYELFPVGKEQLNDRESICSYIMDSERNQYNKQRAQDLGQKKEKAEYVYQLQDGRWILETAFYFYNEKQELYEQILYFENITKKINQQKELERIAYYDSVTRLYNRSYFTSWLEDGIGRAADEFKTVQLVYMDMDYFKRASDTMGAGIGDEIILSLVSVLKTFETNSIRIGRFGDDKFAIGLIGVTEPSAAENLAHAIAESLCEPVLLSNGTKYRITLSIGIAEYNPGMKGAKELIRAADIAMYQIKQHGRNGICCFREEMKKEFQKEMLLEEKLKKAVEEKELLLMYQPQYHTQSEQLRGMEVLIQWKDKELGMIPPSIFIPLAKAGGIMKQMEEWMIQESLKTLRYWVEEYGYVGILSLNISPVQFQNRELTDVLKSCTEEYHLDPHQIELGLTEWILMEDFSESNRLLQKIWNYGYRIAANDLGGLEAEEQPEYLKELHNTSIPEYFKGNPLSKEEAGQLIQEKKSIPFH